MTRIDSKGRITIPQEIREALGLIPGKSVEVGVEDDEVIIRPQVSREEFIDSMVGCINEDTRREDAEPMDPLELKKIWTSHLP